MKTSGPRLYDAQGNITTCERPNWRRCPDHKHLSDRMPDIVLDKIEGISKSIEDRSKPPHLIKLQETEGSALFLDTDGTIYWKQYDEYGGVGSLEVPSFLRFIYRGKAKKAIAEAWNRKDSENDLNI